MAQIQVLISPRPRLTQSVGRRLRRSRPAYFRLGYLSGRAASTLKNIRSSPPSITKRGLTGPLKIDSQFMRSFDCDE
jgi:hypothetical protein